MKMNKIGIGSYKMKWKEEEEEEQVGAFLKYLFVRFEKQLWLHLFEVSPPDCVKLLEAAIANQSRDELPVFGYVVLPIVISSLWSPLINF